MSAWAVAASAVLAPAPAAGGQGAEGPGTIVFDSDGSLFSVTADGASDFQAVEPDDDVQGDLLFDPDLSPDGTTVAFSRKIGDHFDVWTMGVDGSDPRRLTWSATDGHAPSWSPDGRRLAFTSTRKGNMDVYSVALDGTGLRRLTKSSTSDHDPAWSLDGKKIAFVGFDPALADKAFVVSPRGRGRAMVAHADCDDECYVEGVAWSPDGDALGITYFHETEWEARIVAVRSDGTEYEVLGFGWTIASMTWS